MLTEEAAKVVILCNRSYGHISISTTAIFLSSHLFVDISILQQLFFSRIVVIVCLDATTLYFCPKSTTFDISAV